MTKDFRTTSIQTTKIISSGSTGSGAKILVYPIEAEDSGNPNQGQINQNAFNTGSIGTDTFLFISGAVNGKAGSGRDISVFGGDVHISGNLSVDGTGGGGGGTDSDWSENNGLFLSTTSSVQLSGSLLVKGVISGSHTKLSDGNAAFIAGPNVTVNFNSNGAVEITGSASVLDTDWNENGGLFLSTTSSVELTGSLLVKGDISGSHTKLANNTPAFLAGPSAVVNFNPDGAVEISGSTSDWLSVQVITSADAGLVLTSSILYAANLSVDPLNDISVILPPTSSVSVGEKIILLSLNNAYNNRLILSTTDSAIIGMGTDGTNTDVKLQGDVEFFEAIYTGASLGAPIWAVKSLTYDRDTQPLRRSVEVASAAPLPTFTTSGSNADQTLTMVASGSLTIDGIDLNTVATEGRTGVLIGAEVGVSRSYHGVYEIIEPGDGVTQAQLRRRTDWAYPGNVRAGTVVHVERGDTNGGKTYLSPNGLTFGDAFDWISTTAGSVSSTAWNENNGVFLSTTSSVEITGSLLVKGNISGSHTKLASGAAAFLAGPNATVNFNPDGAVEITGSAPGDTDWNENNGLFLSTTSSVQLSGSLLVKGNISGSHTKLSNGSPAFLAGPNATVNFNPDGAVEITGSTPTPASNTVEVRFTGSQVVASSSYIDFQGTSVTDISQSGTGVIAIFNSASITAQDEGSTLTTDARIFDFVGTGVTATNSGNKVTVTIVTGAGGGGGGLTNTTTKTASYTAVAGERVFYNPSAGSLTGSLFTIMSPTGPSTDEEWGIKNATTSSYMITISASTDLIEDPFSQTLTSSFGVQGGLIGLNWTYNGNWYLV